MSNMKWVLYTNLTDHELQYANGDPMGTQVPVIPLSDLAEVVEGLRFIALSKDDDAVVIAKRLLAQLATEGRR